jgi:hypothetical protein
LLGFLSNDRRAVACDLAARTHPKHPSKTIITAPVEKLEFQ